MLKLNVEKIIHFLELFRSKTLCKSDTVSINIYLCNRLSCILLCNRFKQMLRTQKYEETVKEMRLRIVEICVKENKYDYLLVHRQRKRSVRNPIIYFRIFPSKKCFKLHNKLV